MSLSREHLAAGAVIVGIVLLSLFQTVAFGLAKPADAVYPLVHGYPPDYYWYLSLIEQGREGFLLLTSRYTPEAFAPQFVNTFFPILGIIARVLTISSPVMYTLARVVFGASQMLVGYALITMCFAERKKRVTALILIFLGTPFWYLQSDGAIRYVGEFWSGLDPWVRYSFLPHHMAATTLFMLALLGLHRVMKTNNLRFILVAGAAGGLATWTNPASGMMLVLALSIACILSWRSIGPSWKYPAFVFLSVAIPFVFLWRLQSSVFPWTAFGSWERFVFYPMDAVKYLGVIGVPGVLAILSLPFVLGKRAFLWDALVGWFAVPFVGLGILQLYLPISNGRYLQNAYFIPAAILATVGVWELAKRAAARRRWYWTILGVVLLIVAVPSYYESVSQQMRSVAQDKTNLTISVPLQVLAGIAWLGKAGKPQAVVLAPGWISTMIPAFTDKRVVWGHPTFTYALEEKEADVVSYYRFDHPEEAKTLLAKHTVSYIWIESIHPAPVSFTSELSLRLVYSNSSVSLYKVK